MLTVVASRYQDQRVVSTALTHYSLTRLYESVIGARYLGNAAHAPSMRNAFGIRTVSGGCPVAPRAARLRPPDVKARPAIRGGRRRELLP